MRSASRSVVGTGRGALSVLLFALNTVFWTLPLLGAHLLKVLLPYRRWRAFWSGAQNGIGTLWISFNNLTLKLLNPVRWDVAGLEGLRRDAWYLLLANHRTWVDILVLQGIFNRRVPFLKFFLKKELFWVPFLGLAWWSLDYPFLERGTRADRDLRSIRRAAGMFKLRPVTVMNFVEGTRLTPEKHRKQRSSYRHLLKPKAAGLALIVSEMAPRLHGILDVTIVYPGGTPTLWGFVCGEVREIRVRVRQWPLDDRVLGDFAGDKAFRREFTGWLNGLWAEKDDLMETLFIGGGGDGGG